MGIFKDIPVRLSEGTDVSGVSTRNSNSFPLIAGVGGGRLTHWIATEFPDMLNVYGIDSKINMTFNLKSEDDINRKLASLQLYQEQGYCSEDAMNELEERVRTASGFVLGGKGGTNASQDAGVDPVIQSAKRSTEIHYYR